MSGEMRALAELLRGLMEERGITQVTLAEKLGIRPQLLSEIVRGEYLPIISLLEAFVRETAPASRRPMMLKRVERLHREAEAAPHAPALVRSERQIESLLLEKEQVVDELAAIRQDGALLVMFLLRMIARLDRQVQNLTDERDELRHNPAPEVSEPSGKLDELGRELWRTKQQRERANVKLETAQEQRAEAEQRYITAQLEIEELQAELTKLRADQDTTADSQATSQSQSDAELSDDVDDALSKIDAVLHTRAEAMRRLSDDEAAEPSDYPADNSPAREDQQATGDADRPDARGATASEAATSHLEPPREARTPAEAANWGPIHVLHMAERLWRQSMHDELETRLRFAVSLQSAAEIETTSALLRGLKHGDVIHDLFTSAVADKDRQSGERASSFPAFPEQTPQSGFLDLTLDADLQTAPSGFLTLTVDPDKCGTLEVCPIEEAPDTPERRSEGDRARQSARRYPPREVRGTPIPAPTVLFDRQGERERLVRLLAQGRSVRLTGERGSGRTSLLDLLAGDLAGLAPDGVVRLYGHNKHAGDLAYELCATVFDIEGHHVGSARLSTLLRKIGAIVVLDDLELGGDELSRLLDATPECAYLLSVTPDIPLPSDDSHLEEISLGPLSLQASHDLVEWSVGRNLTENERFWVEAVQVATGGKPLNIRQAGALLKRHARSGLPSVSQGTAAIAALIAGLSEETRDVLRLATALGGAMPHHEHLPALVGSQHADTALTELVDCGLLTAAGAGYQMAANVVPYRHQLGNEEGIADCLRFIGEHYAWWIGTSAIDRDRIAVEAPALLAALAALDTHRSDDCAFTAVRLARAAAPKFAATDFWSSWQNTLYHGVRASTRVGRRDDEAYFRHDHGLLHLCFGLKDEAQQNLAAAASLYTSVFDAGSAAVGRKALRLLVALESEEPTATVLRLAQVPD